MAISTTIILTIDPTAVISTPAAGVTTDQIILTFNNGAANFTFTESFFPIRFRPTIVSTLSPDVGNEVNAANLATAINLDANIVLDINATSLANVVTITSSSYSAVSVTGSMITNSKVTYQIIAGTVPLDKSLVVSSYAAGSPDVCVNINAILGITGGNSLYNVYVDNVIAISNQASPITVSLIRGDRSKIAVSDTLGEVIGAISTNNPRKLISSDITTDIINLTTGANITVTVAYISPYVSVYEYSIDGTNYSTTNIFTSLSNGNYTIYVKDALGCIISKSVIVDGATSLGETIFSISDINPIRYSKYEVNKKNNYKNTLSSNSLRLIKYPYIQQFLETDIPTTQFKTNAQYVNVFAIKEDLTTTVLTAIKKTLNTGLSAKSTSTYFDIGDGKSAIYFGAVNTLNPITNAVIGNVDYGFSLPVWANKEGNYVTIDGLGQVKIDSIGYSDTYQAFILEFNISYTGSPIAKNISASYNLQPYEIYEFLAPMTLLPESFNIVIETGVSSTEINFTYISEKIKRVENSNFLFEIDYWDDANIGDMNYQTGVKHKLRVNGYVDYLGEQSTEGYDGDKQYYVTDNTVYNSEIFSFDRLSFQMAQKLRLVVTHSNLVINGIYYNLSEEPEVTGDPNYNFKRFSVTLKSNGDLLLENVNEDIVNTSASLEITAGIAAIQGKALLLWTKNNQ
tara:strand:+ start:1785 stop:3836 length:2052 start_codon:yes stop_codon:yes gene_type:complete